jgi:hypothetical protein
MVLHLLPENRLNNEQFQIFVDMLDTSTQKLVLLHAGGGTGKTFVTCKIFEEMALRNEICCCTCPTGVGALHIPVLGLLASLKATREVKGECQVEAKYYKFYLRSNGCDTRNGN